MTWFLNTRGNATLGIGICDRCRFKYPLDRLRADGNTPGLRVCDTGCWDSLDPYRLPPRQPDQITLRFPRPDAGVSLTLLDGLILQENYYAILTENLEALQTE